MQRDMNTWNAVAIHTEPPAAPSRGYRCRACGHVSEPVANPGLAPVDACAGCGLSIATPQDPVRFTEVQRQFEPLIWWDALAA